MKEPVRKRLIHRVRRRLLIRAVLGVLALLVAMVAGAAAFVAWGVYNVSALQQHTAPVYALLTTALDRSIAQRAEEIEVPSLDDPALAARGLRRYRRYCVQCHGAPGIARDDVGKGLTPVPPNLAHVGRSGTAAEVFWVIKHGIKMTGMPSWRFKFSDEEIWSIVAFIMKMPGLSSDEYQKLVVRVEAGSDRQPRTAPPPAPGPAAGDPQRGKLAMYGYACIACHRVPGMVGPQADVGPPLAGIAERRYIAGVLPNTFENMVRWIRHPDDVDPLSLMPDMGVTKRDAIDIAAYLYTLD